MPNTTEMAEGKTRRPPPEQPRLNVVAMALFLACFGLGLIETALRKECGYKGPFPCVINSVVGIESFETEVFCP